MNNRKKRYLIQASLGLVLVIVYGYLFVDGRINNKGANNSINGILLLVWSILTVRSVVAYIKEGRQV